MGAAEAGGFLAVAGDDPNALVELGGDVLGGADFEKRDAILAAGAEPGTAPFTPSPPLKGGEGKTVLASAASRGARSLNPRRRLI